MILSESYIHTGTKDSKGQCEGHWNFHSIWVESTHFASFPVVVLVPIPSLQSFQDRWGFISRFMAAHPAPPESPPLGNGEPEALHLLAQVNGIILFYYRNLAIRE